MASGNVELVRSIYTAWERGDFSSSEWADPQIEYFMEAGGAVISESRSGVEGLVEGTRAWMASWRDMRFEAEEYRDLDDERVLVLFRFIGRGRKSGLDVQDLEARGAHLFQIRSGRVTNLLAYMNRDRALADLGLPPEGSANS